MRREKVTELVGSRHLTFVFRGLIGCFMSGKVIGGVIRIVQIPCNQ